MSKNVNPFNRRKNKKSFETKWPKRSILFPIELNIAKILKFVNGTDISIWIIIKTLHHNKKKYKHIFGSPISNKQLAEKIGKKERIIQYRIKHLKKLKFIKSIKGPVYPYNTNRQLIATIPPSGDGFYKNKNYIRKFKELLELYYYFNPKDNEEKINRQSGKITRRKNIIDEVVEYWNKKGPPFAKAKHYSKSTIEAKKTIANLFKKHRTELFDIIDRAHDHMSNQPHFKYYKTKRIGIKEFLKPSVYQRKNLDMYNKIKSWWDVFLKMGDEEIYENFYMYKPKGENKDIAETLEEIWREEKTTERGIITARDKKNFALAAKRLKQYIDENKIGRQDIYGALKNFGIQKIRSTSDLAGQHTWEKTIPNALKDYGV